MERLNGLTHEVIGAAIDVHRGLGPGLLESAYQECLGRELELRGVEFERERGVPVCYKGLAVDCAYRLDFLVGGEVVVEVKSVGALLPVHTAQVLTYLRLGGWGLGLLLNFNVDVMTSGIRRLILTAEAQRGQRVQRFPHSAPFGMA
jgi:GxxExxY protein